MPQELIDEIDAWAKRYADEGRSRAIRRLVDLGLKAKGRKAH
jgi:metal-responsive CopG/Arc/MetJ family transcriptional regulator